MATKKYRLLQAGIDSGWSNGEPDTELELDLGESEQALVAAGWIEPAESDKKEKGGKK